MEIYRPSGSQDNSDTQTLVVNLSAIIKLLPISEVINQFADLHYQYAQSWLHYKWYSKLWVSTKYITMARTINDYKLGNMDTATFISTLQDIFYFIPESENPSELLKKAWNSLIAWDDESTQRLNFLIKKNQLIYLISNTNELNIQKIKQDTNSATGRTLDWQEQTTDDCKFQICQNFRLMTSYENGVFKTDGLIDKLVTQLFNEGKTHKNIILVSQYKSDLAKAKELGIECMPADQFFAAVPAPKQASSLNNTRIVVPPSNPAFPLASVNLASSRRNFLRNTPTNKKTSTDDTTSEKALLLRRQ